MAARQQNHAVNKASQEVLGMGRGSVTNSSALPAPDPQGLTPARNPASGGSGTLSWHALLQAHMQAELV